MKNKAENIDKPKKKRRTAWRVIRFVLLGIAVLVFAFVAFFAVHIFNLNAWNEFDPDRIMGADRTLIVYDKDGKEAVRLHASQDRIPVALSQVPLYVQRAFISAEDARFYQHKGVDIKRIFGALWEDIKAGGYVQGASTISQQLIKLSHLTSEKTMTRKLEEAVLAYQMEQRYSKEEILEMYLNYVYFGGGYYGIEAAAMGYFSVHASELSIAQGAMLAGILKSPSKYAPHLNEEASVSRRNHVIALMHEYGYISAEEKEAAQAEPLALRHDAEAVKRGYYIDAALKKAGEILQIDSDTLLTGGYKIYTAMNSALQAYCEELFENNELFPADDCEGALVIQSASGGLVEAMIGGRDSSVAMAFNRATDINRQPGSVIKPIICYAPALENYGYTAATMLLDEESEFGDYKPKNFGDRYYGWVTLREAVKRSLNIPAVKVLSDVGVEAGKAFARRCGIEFDTDDTTLTLALGGFTYGVSPAEIAGAYAVFASGGMYAEPVLVTEIRNMDDEVLYRHEQKSERIMSEKNAYILTSMLMSAIQEGTGHVLGDLDMPLAGKTGTVNEDNIEGNRDAWMAAYNPDYVAVVWMGYDSAKDGKALPPEATGGRYPALVLSDVFRFLYQSRRAPDYEMPPGIIEVKLDLHAMTEDHQAALASVLTPSSSIFKEIFVAGTEPTEESGYWAVPQRPQDFKITFSAANEPLISFRAKESFAVYRLYRVDRSDNTVMLSEWDGDDSVVTFADTKAKSGQTYGYYVVAYHRELYVHSEQVSGPPTDTIFIKVPERIYFGTDEKDSDSGDGF